MTSIVVWRIVKVLPWRCLICPKRLIACHTVPCCWSWELLVCLALCILGLDHTSLTDPSWWLFMESTPLLFPFSLVFPRDMSWCPFFFLFYVNDLSLCLCNFSNGCCLSCMLMRPLFANLFPNLLTCQTFNLTSVSSTTGSAVITLLLMLPKSNSWSFQPRKIHSLIRLSRFHQLISWDLGLQQSFLESSGWLYL